MGLICTLGAWLGLHCLNAWCAVLGVLLWCVVLVCSVDVRHRCVVLVCGLGELLGLRCLGSWTWGTVLVCISGCAAFLMQFCTLFLVCCFRCTVFMHGVGAQFSCTIFWFLVHEFGGQIWCVLQWCVILMHCFGAKP